MTPKMINTLVAGLLAGSAAALGLPPVPAARATHPDLVPRNGSLIFRDDFNSFDKDMWSCEYTCPTIRDGKVRFDLHSGVPANNEGSWSKASYQPQQFTSGTFTVSFALTSRPEEVPVWWGVALYGGSDDEFNEINFGYTTDESYGNTELRFESARRGKIVSLRVDTGFDLYDETWHTGTLEYDSTHVSLYMDGQLLKRITNTDVIPTDPMDFLLGPRVVDGSLANGFTESIDWVEIYN